MLLAIDTGNTNTLFAVHDGNEWRAQWRSATDMTKTADDYAVWLSTLMELSGLKLSQIDDCIISTVVPQSLFNQRNLARRYLNVEPFVVGENVELGVKVNIPKPSEVGADRLVNAVGAHDAYPGFPLIMIDSGTATTFDIVGADGSFEGGIIAPGINLSMKALHEAAAKLPRVAIQNPGRVIGKDTVTAMQSGVLGLYRPDRWAGRTHQRRVRPTHESHSDRRRRLPFRGCGAQYRPFRQRHHDQGSADSL